MDLLLQHGGPGELSRAGEIEQMVVRQAAPEKERQAGRDLEATQPVGRWPAAGVGASGGRILVQAQKEVGINEHPFERELDSRVEATAVSTTPVEKFRHGFQIRNCKRG